MELRTGLDDDHIPRLVEHIDLVTDDDRTTRDEGSTGHAFAVDLFAGFLLVTRSGIAKEIEVVSDNYRRRHPRTAFKARPKYGLGAGCIFGEQKGPKDLLGAHRSCGPTTEPMRSSQGAKAP